MGLCCVQAVSHITTIEKNNRKFSQLTSASSKGHAMWLTLCHCGEVLKRGVFLITLLMTGVYLARNSIIVGVYLTQ